MSSFIALEQFSKKKIEGREKEEKEEDARVQIGYEAKTRPRILVISLLLGENQ